MAPRKKPESIVISRTLSRVGEWAANAPEGAGQYGAHGFIRMTRSRLGMTQAQLAKRCGLTQSHIARIESGKVDMQLSTLGRIFAALHCRLVLAPRPEEALEKIVERQARKAATARVRRVAGTMAMEEQLPEKGMVQELIEAETEKLRRNPSSEIWETH